MNDNLCDSCKKPMSIHRNPKNSRFLRCDNPNCPRIAGKKKAPIAPKEKEKNAPIIPPDQQPKRNPFRIGL